MYLLTMRSESLMLLGFRYLGYLVVQLRKISAIPPTSNHHQHPSWQAVMECTESWAATSLHNMCLSRPFSSTQLTCSLFSERGQRLPELYTYQPGRKRKRNWMKDQQFKPPRLILRKQSSSSILCPQTWLMGRSFLKEAEKQGRKPAAHAAH